MNDVLGQAIWDYYHKTSPKKLWINNHYGEREEMPVSVYFRSLESMPRLELMALENCRGNILDIGAGAGSHALALQKKGAAIAALEISPKAAAIARLRGVKKVIEQDIFTFSDEKFDTLLLLMNGIGLTSNLEGLKNFLQHVKQLLKPNGQLLFDSSDVSYMYDGTVPMTGDYFGEIECQYQYKKQTTEWFTWLYIDQGTLTHIASQNGWQTEVLYTDENDQYLARLTLSE